jgi:hypothetical protein
MTDFVSSAKDLRIKVVGGMFSKHWDVDLRFPLLHSHRSDIDNAQYIWSVYLDVRPNGTWQFRYGPPSSGFGVVNESTVRQAFTFWLNTKTRK